jgi:hypothetical protein
MIEAAIIAALVAKSRPGAAVSRGLMAERGELYDAHARSRAIVEARTGWLEEHQATASFPCGVVQPDAVTLPGSTRDRRPELAVIAAVLPGTVVFLVEPPTNHISPDPIEAGTIQAASITAVEVMDDAGRPAPRPAAEPIDAEPDAFLVIRWSVGDVEREQRLLFRSMWQAWKAADRLRAVVSPDGGTGAAM